MCISAGWTRALIAAISIVVVCMVQPRFISLENLTNVVRQFGFISIFALAQMLPILVRGLDLSQGPLIAFSSVVFAMLSQKLGVAPAMLFTVFAAALVGLINGTLAGLLRVSPFVATMGIGSILGGAALILSNGQPVFEVPASFSALAWISILGFPIVAIVAVLLLAVFWFVLEHMVAGRFVYAVGSNARAAELCGIPVQPTILICYVVSSSLTSIGAILLASRIASGNPTLGLDQTLQSIAAVVIGGVSLFGGRGSVIGVALGALFLATLANALNLMNVTSYLQQVVIGLTIIVAVLFDIWQQEKRTGTLIDVK